MAENSRDRLIERRVLEALPARDGDGPGERVLHCTLWYHKGRGYYYSARVQDECKGDGYSIVKFTMHFGHASALVQSAPRFNANALAKLAVPDALREDTNARALASRRES